MYAIIEDRGNQIKVAPGEVVNIDLMPLDDKKKKHKLTFDRVLLVGDPDSDKPAAVGTPYVDGATVEAEVMEEVAGEKLDVLMYKRRKGQRRKIGHRQRYLRVKITDIKA